MGRLARQRLTVRTDEPIGIISPLLHGVLLEHLGEQIEPGLWHNGLRPDVIAALKPLRLPVVRWPGGCFADQYHWRDGVGPRRPLRANHAWGHAVESNAFGTHELLDLCRALGAEPYLAGNVGTGTPRELADWVEYCNFPSGTALASERATHGGAAPFGVRFWGVGNEAWGCGGNMTPEHYADELARYATFLPDVGGVKPVAVACGPDGPDWNWTQRLMAHLARARSRLHLVGALGAHYYCGTAGTATSYDDVQWIELLAKASAVHGVIRGHRALMDEHDPQRRIPIFLDEWGTWHPPQPDKPPWALFQQNTIRDACVAAITLDILNNHADVVQMACLAQVVNVLQALLLVDGDHVIRTPTFHVMALHQAHREGTALRVVHDCEPISDVSADVARCYHAEAPRPLHAVQGSASVNATALCVTLVNAHPRDPVELELLVTGAGDRVGTLTRLQADDIRAHNDGVHPERVAPRPDEPVHLRSGTLVGTLQPGSVVRFLFP